MKVLVTGANGLLATNTIIELLNRGYQVKGLIRDKNKFTYSEHPNLELINGDITNFQDLDIATKDCDYVIHSAANTNQNLLNLSDYHDVNIEGTVNVLNASLKNNVKKFIFVSTANTFGYGNKTDLGNELKEIKYPFSDSYYAISKLEAQKKVLMASKKIDVVVVNPTFMLGAYDSKPSSGRIILMGLKKYFLFYPPGGKNFIHVNDAANGVINAIEKGKNGEAYLLAGENLSYKEFFKKVNFNTNNDPILIKLPKVLLLFLGTMGDIIRSTGIKTDLSKTNMRILCIENFYTNKKAKEELYLTFKPIEDAIDDAINWFKTNGKIN
jgi:nucleoside-diphosphate-sugar epimerase